MSYMSDDCRESLVKVFLLVFLFNSWNWGEVRAEQVNPVDYVNPLIDTHNSRWFYFSSACRPFGMVNLSPDTGVQGSWTSGYLYDVHEIQCFSHIHAWQLSGIPVMPVSGEMQGHLGMDANKSAFSHADEVVEPGYHKVHLERYDIEAELTSTTRVGLHKYSFPADTDGHVLFYTGAFLGHGPIVTSEVTKVNDKEIAGYSLLKATHRRPKDTYVYFVARFNKEITRFGGWQKGSLTEPSDQVTGPEIGAFASFDSLGKDPLFMKVGLSYTSVENAGKNIDSELPHWDFERVRKESKEEWNHWLSKIRIQGGSEQQKTKFYTDLWHALLGRRIMSDAHGAYCDMTGSDPAIRMKEKDEKGEPRFPHYNFDALWGSHWSLNVLWSLAYPDVVDGFCNTMVDMYRDGGLIPRGPSGGNYTYVMIGDPASSFFATAYNKGIRDYDVEAAYEGLKKNAFPSGIRDHAGYEHSSKACGGGMSYYVDLGYVPQNMGGSGGHRGGAAMTLEYAYQDWCLAQFAKALGKKDDYDLFMKRSQNYRNVWNETNRLMQPRMKNGEWMPNFVRLGGKEAVRGFVESNSVIYSHYVPHDMHGLIGLFGGNEEYAKLLNHSFEHAAEHRFVAEHGRHAEKYVDYDNQPGTAMAHLFNYCGKPWLSQKWVREVKLKAHGDASPYGGYDGDEDQGQMGALGVLMAMGLFQVDGGASVNSIYEITTPLFDRIEISLDQSYYLGNTFEIIVKNQSPENTYIQSATLNGEPLDRCWIYHRELAQGGVLELVVGAKPNKEWGISEPPGLVGHDQ